MNLIRIPLETADALIYLATALLTIVWSVWIYLWWHERAELPEDSPARFLLIIMPSSYFLILAVSGWARAISIRLDLIGLIAFDIITILFAFFLALAMRGAPAMRGRRYIIYTLLHSILSLAVITAIYLIRVFPPFLIRFSTWIRQFQELNLMQLAWIGLNPETHERDVVDMMNRIVIALFSYIPISIIRILYMSRRRIRLERDLEQLRNKVSELEEKLMQGR